MAKKPSVVIEVTGIGEVLKRIRAIGQDVEDQADLTIVKMGAFIEDEVKESIIGQRAEPRSVDTGELGNSIQANKIGRAAMEIAPSRKAYSGGQTTDEVAKFLEYGTTKIRARRHFRNTAKRNEKKIRNAIDQAVKKATK